MPKFEAKMGDFAKILQNLEGGGVNPPGSDVPAHYHLCRDLPSVDCETHKPYSQI